MDLQHPEEVNMTKKCHTNYKTTHGSNIMKLYNTDKDTYNK